MGKLNSKSEELRSTCDDKMFMSSEIILKYKPSDGLHGIKMDIEYQCGSGPAYLRAGDIKQLIENLNYFLSKIEK